MNNFISYLTVKKRKKGKSCIQIFLLSYYILCENSTPKEQHVRIHIQKIVGKKYLNELIILLRFVIMPLMENIHWMPLKRSYKWQWKDATRCNLSHMTMTTCRTNCNTSHTNTFIMHFHLYNFADHLHSHTALLHTAWNIQYSYLIQVVKLN